jgi:BirA family biotin operon repressor/biotin-[acetyl-CoA-carboxylase] ligase
MVFRLGEKALSRGYRLASYETIGSTNTEASERARGGDPGRLWVVSGEQTAGRGRRGRAWQTAPGNLAASLLLINPARGKTSATLGFAAGLALESAVHKCAPEIGFRVALDGASGKSARLRLKWPNDVLVDGGKVAGILLQAASLPGGATAVVIGIGVNVRHAPRDVPYPATTLAACGSDVDAATLFEALSDAWVEQESIWDQGRGFGQIRKEWLARAAGLGAPIAVQSDNRIFRGTFETIDDEGQLVVRTADGSTRLIAAGDVHFGAAATVGH